MKHFPFDSTPVILMPYYSQKWGVNVLCKRDDMFTEAGGGSKARMLQYILAEVNKTNTDVVLTAGGPCSNFNRACALMCAKLGVKMHLVAYTEEPDEYKTSLNFYMCQLAGVQITKCDKQDVVATLQLIQEQYVKEGKKVKSIYGGGKSLEGVFAYYDAAEELSKQVNEIDAVFVACGTGTTLTGIVAGMQRFFPQTQVHAISAARSWDAERVVLMEDMKILNSFLGTKYDFSNLKFSADYLCGGYAKYSECLMQTIHECISHEGMIVDPTYSGKAFWGMSQEIEKNLSAFVGKNVLFWNTGGIFNLLSTLK